MVLLEPAHLKSPSSHISLLVSTLNALTPHDISSLFLRKLPTGYLMCIPPEKNSIPCTRAFIPIESNHTMTNPPVTPTTPIRPANKPTTLTLPLRLIPALLVARSGLPVVTLASLPDDVICGFSVAVTILVNVDFGGVPAVVVLMTTDVVALGKRAVMGVRVGVEAENVEVWLVGLAIVVVRHDEAMFNEHYRHTTMAPLFEILFCSFPVFRDAVAQLSLLTISPN